MPFIWKLLGQWYKWGNSIHRIMRIFVFISWMFILPESAPLDSCLLFLAIMQSWAILYSSTVRGRGILYSLINILLATIFFFKSSDYSVKEEMEKPLGLVIVIRDNKPKHEYRKTERMWLLATQQYRSRYLDKYSTRVQRYYCQMRVAGKLW